MTLPGMAAQHRWPIRFDHCFMRVCLDDAIGAQWNTVVRSPAIRHLTDEQLAHAIATAERIADAPALLVPLNDASLVMRGKRPLPAPSPARRQRV